MWALGSRSGETIELFVPTSSEPKVSLGGLEDGVFFPSRKGNPLASPVMAIPLVYLEDYAILHLTLVASFRYK